MTYKVSSGTLSLYSLLVIVITTTIVIAAAKPGQVSSYRHLARKWRTLDATWGLLILLIQAIIIKITTINFHTLSMKNYTMTS